MLHFRSRILSFEIQLLSCAIFALIDTQIRGSLTTWISHCVSHWGPANIL